MRQTRSLLEIFGWPTRLGSWLLALFLGALPLHPQDASAQYCDIPVYQFFGWWRAEGNTQDSAGYNNLVAQGNVGFTAGKVGQAFDFNGTGYFLGTSTQGYDPNGDLTIELWVRRTGTNSSMGLISKWNSTCNSANIEMYWTESQGIYCFGIATGPNTLPLNTWTHVVASLGNGYSTIYLNGALVASSTGCCLGLGAVNTRPLSIGYDCAHGFFTGQLDEITIYQTALGLQQSQALYASGAAGKCLTAVKIISQPQGGSVPAGEGFALSVNANGTTPITYQWRLNGTNLPGATGASLSLTNLQISQAGAYSVALSNLAGTTNSANALLNVLIPVCSSPAPSMVAWWRAEGNHLNSAGSDNLTAVGSVGFGPGAAGQGFNLDGSVYLRAADSPALDFGLNSPLSLEVWARRTGTNSTMSLVSKFSSDCSSANFALSWNELNGIMFNGVGTSTDTLPLNTWTHILAVFDGGTYFIYVNGALFGSSAGFHALGPINHEPITIGHDCLNGGFSGQLDEITLYSGALTATQARALYLSGSAGKCLTPASFKTQPLAATIGVDEDGTFSVEAMGTTPFGYQWLFNGTNLPGATNSTLIVARAQPAQAGTYSVVVSNPVGSVSSSNVVLNVVVPNCAPIPNGLAGWWRAEGEATDFPGTNAGILRNGVSFASGVVGQAFDLNGVNQFVEITASNLFSPAASMTVEAWVYPRIPNDAVASPILKQAGEGTAPQDGYALELYPDGTTRFSVYLYGVGWTSSSAGATPPNHWTHLVGVYSGSQLILYTNGVATTPVSAHGAIVPSGNSLEIGQDPANVGRHFNGLVDEASIYSAAISAAQAQALYDSHNVGKCQPSVPPTITLQPQGRIVSVSEDVAFLVKAAGTTPFHFQWRRDDTNLAGASQSALTLPDAQVNQTGNYTVVVSNDAGSITSSVASLTVLAMVPGQIVVCDSFSLAAALTAGGAITFGCDGILDLNQPLIISQDTVLDAGNHDVTISGNNAVRPFHVNPGVHLTLLNLNIANGSQMGASGATNNAIGQAGVGGGIYVEGGTLTAVHCRFIGNSAIGGSGGLGGNGGAGWGGAIYNAGGFLNLTDCTFINNQALGGASGGLLNLNDTRVSGSAGGGAIFNANGSMTLANCTFTGNSGLASASPGAIGQGTAAAGGNAFGGAIYLLGGTAAIESSYFGKNQSLAPTVVSTTTGTGGQGSGGAIYQLGGSLTLSRTSMVTNQASGGGLTRYFGNAGEASGGGIFTTGTLKATNCSFLGNLCTAGGYGAQAGAARGGAIYDLGNALLVHCFCSGNQVMGGNGGSLFLNGVTQPGPGLGGGIFVSNSLVLQASTVSDNTAIGGMGGYASFGALGAGTLGLGGGVYSTGIFNATNSTIANNLARGGPGNAPGPLAMGAGGEGVGGAMVNSGGSATLTYCTVAGNHANGGSGMPVGPSLGGGILTTNGSFTIYDSIVSGNQPANFEATGSSVNDGGYNLSSDHSFLLVGVGSRNNTDPLLSPLADHGGSVPTMLPLPGSPAIDSGDPSFCLPTDEREIARPFGTACDLGAVESLLSIRGTVNGYLPPGGISLSNGSASVTTDAAGNFSFINLLNGDFTITPTTPGILFVPPQRVVHLSDAVSGIDFQAYLLNQLTAQPPTPGGLNFQIVAVPGKVEIMELSTNLVTWIPVVTNTVGADNILNFQIPDNSALPKRFFRTRSQ